MERGLIWLPLLIIFFWLAIAGWNEYQKVETYQAWATGFEKAKYDILAVLGQQQDQLTWGQPSRKGPINLQTFSLQEVQSIWLLVDKKSVDLDHPPEKGGNIELEFQLEEAGTPIRIPFTEIALAAKWGKYLRYELEKVQGLIEG
jgi:hypothetical protein